MSKSTLVNYVSGETTNFIDERYNNVGSGTLQLGTVKRAFIETDFTIEEGDSNGTELTLNVDYEFTNKDTYYTGLEGVNVWTGINILNAAYQVGELYITYKAVGSYVDKTTIDGLITDVATNTANITTIQAQLGNAKTVTSDYTILDDDGFDKFYINPSERTLTITLPTLADNSDRKLLFLITDLGGKVTIDGEGAETIGGETSIAMQSKNDTLEIIAESGEWQIVQYNSRYDTGFINTNDFSNRHFGTSAFDYDNLSGNFIVGELITEETSGNTGIIQSDDETTLYVKNVTGTGIWTNNKEITGSTSGATADVNEVAGSNKNQDTNILHDYGYNYMTGNFKMTTRAIISEDKTEAASYDLTQNIDASSLGACTTGIDENNVKVQTGSSGMVHLNDSGTGTAISTQDWYYKIIIEVSI